MPTIALQRRRHVTRRGHIAPTPALRVLSQLARARRSGGPQDRALYRCGCGHSFTAAVSTSVGCPSCGETQAW